MEQLLQHYPALAACREDIEKSVRLMADAYQNGGKLLLCGNGGSCADCDHIAGELLKGFLSQRPLSRQDRDKFTALFPQDGAELAARLQYAVPAISLPAQTAALSAFGNDVAPQLGYAQLVWAYGKPHDLLLGISTSGNSENVVNAVKTARAMGLTAIGLTGQAPCRLDGLCHVTIKAPATQTYRVQEYHLPIYHYLCAKLEALCGWA